jgi:hypothetical protein
MSIQIQRPSPARRMRAVARYSPLSPPWLIARSTLLPQLRAAVGIDQLPQLGDVGPVLAEHAVQVGREADRARYRIAFPHRHARRHQALLQALFAVAHRALGLFELGHVGAGAEPLDDARAGVAQRHDRTEEAAVTPVRAAQREGHLVGRAAHDGLAPAPHDLGQDGRVVQIAPVVDADFARRGAGERVPAVVEPDDGAVRVGHPHHLRDVVRQLVELAALRLQVRVLFVQAVEHAVDGAGQADHFAAAGQRRTLAADAGVAQAGGKGFQAAQVARQAQRQARGQQEHQQRQ